MSAREQQGRLAKRAGQQVAEKNHGPHGPFGCSRHNEEFLAELSKRLATIAARHDRLAARTRLSRHSHGDEMPNARRDGGTERIDLGTNTGRKRRVFNVHTQENAPIGRKKRSAYLIRRIGRIRDATDAARGFDERCQPGISLARIEKKRSIGHGQNSLRLLVAPVRDYFLDNLSPKAIRRSMRRRMLVEFKEHHPLRSPRVSGIERDRIRTNALVSFRHT